MPTRRKGLDPLGSYNFFIDGISSGRFRNVEGLQYEIEMIEYRISDQPMLPRFRPGLPKAPRITLKRGYLTNGDLNEWIEKVQKGEYKRQDASIELRDNTGELVASWDLLRCLPTKWSLSGFDGKSNEVVVEQVELVVEELIHKPAGGGGGGGGSSSGGGEGFFETIGKSLDNWLGTGP